MALFRERMRDQRMLAEINITPFVDVMLVLLIIFMVTTPLLQQGLPVNLPEASAPAIKRSKSDVILTVKSNGNIYLEESKVALNLSNLSEQLKQIYSVREEKDLFIRADSTLLYGTVVKIMSIAKEAGVDRIGMLTQPERER